MASSETLAVRPLGMAEAEAGLALSAAAGWNQTADDWRLFLGHGRTVGCHDAQGRLVASAAALPYGAGAAGAAGAGADFGWIAMVLVDPLFRHRGLATVLMDRCVRMLAEAGLTPVLDATPAGAEVYRRIGFVPGFELDRWQGDGTGQVQGAARADARVISALDGAATGLERAVVIEDFIARPSSLAWLAADGNGFAILRRGHRAWQLGPLVAADERSALLLLRQALAAAVGRVFLDVPRCWAALTAWLSAHGFVRQRGFVRMALGRAAPAPSERVFVLAGPEFG